MERKQPLPGSSNTSAGASATPRDGDQPRGGDLPHMVMETGGGQSGDNAGQVILEMGSASVEQPPQLSRRKALEGLCGSPAHVRMLEEWQREEEAARRHMQRKDKNVGAAHSEVYQLLALFSLVQGGLFAALAQSSLLPCTLWWCPFAISLTVTAGTLAALLQRLRALATLREELRQWRHMAEALFTCIYDLKTQGALFDLNTVPELPESKQESEQSGLLAADELPPPLVCRHLSWDSICSYDTAVISTVVVISLVVLYACRRILCNPCHCN